MVEFSEIIARAVVAQARRACREKACGCEMRMARRGKPHRCGDCPMNDVDPVVEALRERNPLTADDE
jgi:hypothetical protein